MLLVQGKLTAALSTEVQQVSLIGVLSHAAEGKPGRH